MPSCSTAHPGLWHFLDVHVFLEYCLARSPPHGAPRPKALGRLGLETWVIRDSTDVKTGVACCGLWGRPSVEDNSLPFPFMGKWTRRAGVRKVRPAQASLSVVVNDTKV